MLMKMSNLFSLLSIFDIDHKLYFVNQINGNEYRDFNNPIRYCFHRAIRLYEIVF